MPRNRITLELGGLPAEEGFIELSDFLGALQQFKSGLAQADLAASNGRTAKLRVVELSMASPARIAVEIVPLKSTADFTDEITRTFFAATRRQIDPAGGEANLALVNAVRNLASMVGKSFGQAIIKNTTDQVPLTPELRAETDKALVPEYSTKGTVRGRLEFMNLHRGANKFRIYPLVGPRIIVCRFSDEKKDEAIAAVDKRVAVTGILHYKSGSYFPNAIDVTEIHVLRADDDLPALSRLRGAAPNVTDGLKSEDFVRHLRDAWSEN